MEYDRIKNKKRSIIKNHQPKDLTSYLRNKNKQQLYSLFYLCYNIDNLRGITSVLSLHERDIYMKKYIFIILGVVAIALIAIDFYKKKPETFDLVVHKSILWDPYTRDEIYIGFNFDENNNIESGLYLETRTTNPGSKYSTSSITESYRFNSSFVYDYEFQQLDNYTFNLNSIEVSEKDRLIEYFDKFNEGIYGFYNKFIYEEDSNFDTKGQ